jgi:hypothetical protein
MVALTKGRKTARFAGGGIRNLPVAAAAVCFTGGLAIAAAGFARPGRVGQGGDNTARAADAATYRAVGVFMEDVTGGAANGDVRVDIQEGIFLFANVQTGTTNGGTNAVYSLGVSDVGKPAYVVDDQTVGASSNALYSVAGTCVYVEPDSKFVWVDVGKAWAGSIALQPFVLPSASTGLASGRLYIVNTASITNGVGIVP